MPSIEENWRKLGEAIFNTFCTGPDSIPLPAVVKAAREHALNLPYVFTVELMEFEEQFKAVKPEDFGPVFIALGELFGFKDDNDGSQLSFLVKTLMKRINDLDTGTGAARQGISIDDLREQRVSKVIKELQEDLYPYLKENNTNV